MEKRKVLLNCPIEDAAQQHFKERCNINNILASYEKNGMITHLNRNTPQYGDYSKLKNFKESLDLVQTMDSLFMSLPPRVRSRFQNDPAQLIDFMNNESNREEAIKLGLIEKPVEIIQEPKNDDKTTIPAPPSSPQS